MRKVMFGLVLIATLALALMPSKASATTIPANCGTCGSHNTSFDITYIETNTTDHIYTFTVKATYGSPTDFVYLDDLAFKIDAATYQGGTPNAPTSPAEDTWTVVAGGISSGGCHLNLNNGFWCLQANNLGASHGGAGDTDTWTVQLDLASALGATAAGSFKAHFTDASGNKVNSLISESVLFGACTVGCDVGPQPQDFGEAPEPGSLILLGTGLIGFAAGLRRRLAR